MRDWLRRLYAKRFKSAADSSRVDLRRSAIVFAPHQDDEVLGCGGTILRKRQIGADVKIVFISDGSQSHKGLIEPDVLAHLRKCEAIAAAAALQVAESDVFFLGLADGQLSKNSVRNTAIAAIEELLHIHTPQEIYIPYRHEPHPDHDASFSIVMAALQCYPQKTIVWEYSVWFWRFWPWVNRGPVGLRFVPRRIKENIKANWQLLRDFQDAVNIENVITDKRKALSLYSTQVARMHDRPEWFVLGDAFNGEFLNCCFAPQEIFSYRLHSGASTVDS